MRNEATKPERARKEGVNLEVERDETVAASLLFYSQLKCQMPTACLEKILTKGSEQSEEFEKLEKVAKHFECCCKFMKYITRFRVNM